MNVKLADPLRLAYSVGYKPTPHNLEQRRSRESSSLNLVFTARQVTNTNSID